MTTLQQSPSSKLYASLKYWGPVFLYALLIVVLSSQSYPEEQLPPIIFNVSDKLLHGIEYGILGILLYRAFKQTHKTSRSILLSMACLIVFGISDELHQWFVPHRNADVWDLVADTFGGVFLILGWVFLTENRRTQQVD